MNHNNQIRFAIPIDIEKGRNAKGEEVYKFRGLASTTDRDNQGEVLNSSVYDLSNFKTVNWNHKSKDTADAYLGEITKHQIGSRGLEVEGELFPEMAMTKSVVNLMKAFKKRGRQLQLSVEGSVIKRGSDDENHPDYKNIVKAKLTGVAITPNAVNSNTFCDLVEKGYTDIVDWQYDKETELIMKSVESGEINDEVDEENAEKSMTADDNVPISKESVEAAVKKQVENQAVETPNKNTLSKSQIYESIFNYFYPIDLSKAQKIYSLIQKTSVIMATEITEETINKALEILDIASKNKIEKSEDNDADDMNKDEDNENESGEEKEEGEEKLEKGKKKKIEKSENTDLSKSLELITDVIEKSTHDQQITLSAVATVVKGVYDQNKVLIENNKSLAESNELLKSELETLSADFNKFLSTPNQRKSIADVRSIERFEKSTDGVEIYTISNKDSKRALINKAMALSGLDTVGYEKADRNMLNVATDLETTGTLSPASMQYLSSKNIAVRQ